MLPMTSTSYLTPNVLTTTGEPQIPPLGLKSFDGMTG
jgi:hypothetical protein